VPGAMVLFGGSDVICTGEHSCGLTLIVLLFALPQAFVTFTQ